MGTVLIGQSQISADEFRGCMPQGVQSWVQGFSAIRLAAEYQTALAPTLTAVLASCVPALQSGMSIVSMRRMHAELVDLLKKSTNPAANYPVKELKVFAVQLGEIVACRHGLDNPTIVRIAPGVFKSNSRNIHADVFLPVIDGQEKVHLIHDSRDMLRRLGWEGMGSSYREVLAMLDPFKVNGIMMSIQAVYFNHARLPGNIQQVLHGTNPVDGPLDSVAFCSVSTGNVVKASFGEEFIRAVVNYIAENRPYIQHVYTLSPMQELCPWIDKLDQASWGKLGGEKVLGLGCGAFKEQYAAATSPAVLNQNLELIECMRRLAVLYLADGHDPAAKHMHLKNGAEVARICVGANPFDYGWRQSRGFMVNHHYPVFEHGCVTTKCLDQNKVAFKEGKVVVTMGMQAEMIRLFGRNDITSMQGNSIPVILSL